MHLGATLKKQFTNTIKKAQFKVAAIKNKTFFVVSRCGQDGEGEKALNTSRLPVV